MVAAIIAVIVAALALAADQLAIDEIAPEPHELDGWSALDRRSAWKRKAGLRDQNCGDGKTRNCEQHLHVVIPPVFAEAERKARPRLSVCEAKLADLRGADHRCQRGPV